MNSYSRIYYDKLKMLVSKSQNAMQLYDTVVMSYWLSSQLVSNRWANECNGSDGVLALAFKSISIYGAIGKNNIRNLH